MTVAGHGRYVKVGEMEYEGAAMGFPRRERAHDEAPKEDRRGLRTDVARTGQEGLG